MANKRTRTVPFAPEPGAIYQNHGGGTFRCIRSLGLTTAEMQNTKSGWTFTTHSCRLYGNGTIEWDYSTSGRFEKCLSQ